eukprot:Rmarinus@m.17632
MIGILSSAGEADQVVAGVGAEAVAVSQGSPVRTTRGRILGKRGEEAGGVGGEGGEDRREMLASGRTEKAGRIGGTKAQHKKGGAMMVPSRAVMPNRRRGGETKILKRTGGAPKPTGMETSGGLRPRIAVGGIRTPGRGRAPVGGGRTPVAAGATQGARPSRGIALRQTIPRSRRQGSLGLDVVREPLVVAEELGRLVVVAVGGVEGVRTMKALVGGMPTRPPSRGLCGPEGTIRAWTTDGRSIGARLREALMMNVAVQGLSMANAVAGAAGGVGRQAEATPGPRIEIRRPGEEEVIGNRMGASGAREGREGRGGRGEGAAHGVNGE